MKKIIPNKPIRGVVRATESKSYVHRYLIASYLSGNGNKVMFENRSDDVMATLNGIKTLLETGPEAKAIIQCAGSGTTFRFLLPIAAALGKDTKFMISDALSKRPTEALYEALSENGASIKELDYEVEKCIRVRDKLFPGVFEIPGFISSQFVSGLMFALPLLNGQSTIIVRDGLNSKSYVDMTIAVLAEAGVQIIEEEPEDPSGSIAAVYRVPGNQRYALKGDILVEGDWSHASVWLAAGTLSGPVTCMGLNMESLQGDRRIVDILKEFGAELEIRDDRITVSKSCLKGIEIDLVDNPDLVPAVWLLASQAEGETKIAEIDKRRFAEYHRLKTIKAELEKLISANESDELICLDSHGDHRIAMVEAAAACIAKHPVELTGSEVVTKSYPTFFRDLEYLQNG